MADTNFVDGTTVIVANWLNDVNDAVYTAIGDGTTPPTTAANVRTNLGLTASGGAALVGNSPAGSIVATTVQAAIDELDTEKASLASNTFTGAQVINVSSGDAVTITNTGSGNSLVVEDSANPDSTPFLVDASGVVIAGGTTSVSGSGGLTGLVQVGGNLSADSFTADAFGRTIEFQKSRSATRGTHSVAQSGDAAGNIIFSASDGTGFIRAAQIHGAIDGTPGTNDMPGRLVFSTTADGGSSPTEAVRIDSAQLVGIGGTPTAGRTLEALKNMTGSTTVMGIRSAGQVQSDATTDARLFTTSLSTQAAAFTLPNAYHFYATQSTIGAGSTVTAQYGFLAESNLTGATNNYGFFGNIASGTGRYNLYMNGTAANYMAGVLALGALPLAGASLTLRNNLTGGVNAWGIVNDGTIQSDVTTSARYFATNAITAASAVTLTNLHHYRAEQQAFGAGSAVTNQYGFAALSSLTGATNNYGLYTDIPAASGRWNLYGNGTARSLLNGDLTVFGSTAIPAGGTAGTGIMMSSTANFGVFFGSGAPTLAAAKGSLYLRSDGSSSSTRMYVNSDGATAWVAVTTAS